MDWLTTLVQNERERWEDDADRRAQRLNKIHEERMDRSVTPWCERLPREILLSILQNLDSRDLSNFSATAHMQNNVAREANIRHYMSSDNPLATFLISHGQDEFDWYTTGLMRLSGIESDREKEYIEANTGKALMILVAAWSRRFTRHRRAVGVPPRLLVFLLKVQDYLRSWVYRPAMKDIVVACECLAAMIGLRRFHVYTSWSKSDFDRTYGEGDDYVFYEPTTSDIWPFRDNGWTVYSQVNERLLTLAFYKEQFSATRTGIALTKKLSQTLIYGLFLDQIEPLRVFKGSYLLPLTFALFTFVRSFIFARRLHSEYFLPRIYDSKLLWASEFKLGLSEHLRFVVQEFTLSENGEELLGSDTTFSGFDARWTSLAEAYEIVRMIGEKHNVYMLYYFHKRLTEYRDEHPLATLPVSRVLDHLKATYGRMFHPPAIRHGANHVFFRFDELDNMYTLMRDGRYARDGPLGVLYTDRSWGQVRAQRLPLPEFIEDHVRLPHLRFNYVVGFAALETLIFQLSDPNNPDFAMQLALALSLLSLFSSHFTSHRGSSLDYLDWNEPRFIGPESVVHDMIVDVWATSLALILYSLPLPHDDPDTLRFVCSIGLLQSFMFIVTSMHFFGATRGGIQDLLIDVAGGVPYLLRKLLNRTKRKVDNAPSTET